MIITILNWLNSLNNWQQAIVGVPYAILFGMIAIKLLKKLNK
jgi:hypothetical protein